MTPLFSYSFSFLFILNLITISKRAIKAKTRICLDFHTKLPRHLNTIQVPTIKDFIIHIIDSPYVIVLFSLSKTARLLKQYTIILSSKWQSIVPFHSSTSPVLAVGQYIHCRQQSAGGHWAGEVLDDGHELDHGCVNEWITLGETSVYIVTCWCFCCG